MAYTPTTSWYLWKNWFVLLIVRIYLPSPPRFFQKSSYFVHADAQQKMRSEYKT